MVGISPKGEVYPASRSFFEASKWTFQALYEMFTFVPKLFTRAGLSSLSGPIGIISMTGEAATGGLMSLLFLWPTSVSLLLLQIFFLFLLLMEVGLSLFSSKVLQERKYPLKKQLRYRVLHLFLCSF